MKRIIFLDDNYDRHLYFDELRKNGVDEIHHIFLPYECMKRMTMYDGFDEVHLDHDLGIDFNDSGSPVPLDAKNVVRFMIQNKVKASFVNIHSSNLNAAIWMETVLKEAGYNTTRKEFDFGDFYTRESLRKEKQQEFLDRMRKLAGAE